MKGLKSLQHTLCLLNTSGKLDDVTHRRLQKVIADLRHKIQVMDRRNAQRLFELLCEELVLMMNP